jgi:hypothetical protein
VVLVGAVGIENNVNWNFKNLQKMLGCRKPLKRNNGKCKGILIGPSMAPRFVCKYSSLALGSPPTDLAKRVGFGTNFAARMASRQTTLFIELAMTRFRALRARELAERL